MRTYLLPEPSKMELALLRRLSGSTRQMAAWKVFPSGEIHVRVRGVAGHVCVIGRTAPPAGNLLRTMLLADTLRRNGARRITLILPYYAYARQDRQTRDGDPVSAICVSRALASAGIGGIVTLDMHSPRVIAASPIAIKNVSVMPKMARALAAELRGREFCVVAADRGGKDRADLFAETLGLKTGTIWIDKKRGHSGKVAARRMVGGPAARTAVIVDDILDTGGTIAAAVALLKKHGCREFFLCVVHPVFSAGASRLVRKLRFRRILISDAFPAPADLLRSGRVRVIGSVDVLARAVI